jgi:hypothetical protein
MPTNTSGKIASVNGTSSILCAKKNSTKPIANKMG